MLKRRVIPALLYKDVGLVKGVGFQSWRRVGSAMQAIKVFNLRDVDELLFLDVSATPAGREPDFALIDELADECTVPFTVGGGVRSVQHFQRLLAVGADKVAVNTAAVETPALIRSAAEQFGRQCVVVAIDFRRQGRDRAEVFTHCGTRPTGLDPAAWAAEVERLGAGEILLTSIDRDGTMTGYDLEITHATTRAVSVPVIAMGGAGDYPHMADAILQGGAQAVTAGAMFQFTERTPAEAKRYLRTRGIPVRL
ncbi:MAG: imidazole glycerol phosphate synthase subunit HisF [Alphaproteobacteria bacterium]|nr:imidazole glycerol phosphate synthase subunit HisF [Alphaproteobacteria bacterium]